LACGEWLEYTFTDVKLWVSFCQTPWNVHNMHSSRKMPKQKTVCIHVYICIWIYYHILFDSYQYVEYLKASATYFLVYLEDTLSSRISFSLARAACYEIGMSSPGHFTFFLWNLEDTHWVSQMLSLLFLLGWCFTSVWRVPKINPPCLCLGQALISGTPYSSCDMHTIHKNSLIYILDSFQASQYFPTWLMCQLPNTCEF
jgi:hypothetical protein